MAQTHIVIFVPGLGDEVNSSQVRRLIWATNRWKKHGVEPVVYLIDWYSNQREFKPKLKKLLREIDKYSKKGYKVSLVGCSAGGSAVLNAFIERRESICKVIDVCGRLRKGIQKGFRSFESRTYKSQAFAEAVEGFENREYLLSSEDRKRIMTIRPLLGDELVPASTNILNGANNITVPLFEHGISIFASLTVFSKNIIKFIESE
ncbi:MAG: hypothetical protein WCO33_02725 [bacterium]